MKRIIKLVILLVVIVAIGSYKLWGNTLLQGTFIHNRLNNMPTEYIPFFLLISFGCYSLGTISYRLMTFPECPEEAKLLEQERKQAREFLRKNGVDVSTKG